MIQNGYNDKDVLMFVLFFAHQCNTTVTIVNAMVAIMSGDFKMSKSESFYCNLCKACCKCKGLTFKDGIKDVGAGIENRHRASSALILSEDEAKLYCTSLRKMLKKANDDVSVIPKHDTKALLLCHYNLCAGMRKKFRNIGPVRSMHLVSLASLVSLVPLAFYVHVPMHNSGGPGNFLKEQMGWEVTRHQYLEENDDAKLIGWTASLMKEMCLNFGPEWTPNMLENATCIMCHCKEKKDVHYLLPWNCVKSGHDNSYHQLEFRVFGNKQCEWELLCFDGKSKHTILSRSKPALLEVNVDETKIINTKFFMISINKYILLSKRLTFLI